MMWNKKIQLHNELKFWLLDMKSLSYRIRSIAKLEIIPVKTSVKNIFLNEKKELGNIKSEHLYLREVLI